MFSLRNKKNILELSSIPLLFGALMADVTVVNYEKLHVKYEHIFVISSPEHEVLKVSYYDRYLSVP